MSCEHKRSTSIFLAETEDHVTLCLDCRIVTHWCNEDEDQWRDLEASREPRSKKLPSIDVLIEKICKVDRTTGIIAK